MAATWTLHIQTGDDDGTTRVLELGIAPIRVGRGIHCEVRLHQVGLGDVQCTLRRRGDEWQVQPVGPPGRIWVDNRPTETQRVVPPGVALRVGRATLTIHETDPTLRERGSFAVPISLDAETIATTPAPVAMASPEPEAEPEPVLPIQPPIEPPAAEATDDRVQRWQTRLDQRDQWLKDRQSERRWEARWKAAGETLRARSAPPVASPSPVAPARPEPTPPPPPVRPLPGRTSGIRASEPRPVFGHLKRVADPERVAAEPSRLLPRTESSPPPPESVPEPTPAAEPTLALSAPSAELPVAALAPTVDPIAEPRSPVVGSSLTDFEDVDAVLADLNLPASPIKTPRSLQVASGIAAPTESPASRPSNRAISESAGTGAILRPRVHDIHPTSQLEFTTGTVPPGVGAPKPCDVAAVNPRQVAEVCPEPEAVPTVAVGPTSPRIELASAFKITSSPEPEPEAAQPTAPVRVPRLKLYRRIAAPVESSREPTGPDPTVAAPPVEVEVTEAIAVSPGSIQGETSRRPGPPTSAPGDPFAGVGKLPPAIPADAETGRSAEPPRQPSGAKVAFPASRPEAPPRPGTRPGAAPPESKEWPSARTIFAAQGTRATADGAALTVAEPVKVRRLPEPTDPVRPDGWTIPLVVGWVPSALIVLALGGFAVGLAVIWLEDASSGNIAVRLATRSVAAHSPVIDPQTIPKSAWWQTTASHLAAWALTLERVGNGEDRTAEARALEADARSVSPLGARARFVSEPVPGQEADVAASIRLGPTRDVVTLTAMGHRLRRENKRADALRAYRTAFLTAATTPRSTLNRPDFRDDPQVNRYALPHASLLDGIALNMAAAGDWTPEEWTEATPEFGPALLAVASALRAKDPGESDRRLEAICQVGSRPLAEAFEAAEHLAAIAEALAERKRWTDAVAQYRLAIEGETRDLDRRVWWFNLAEVARRNGDEPLRNQAIESAKGADLSDEVTQRAANAHRNAPEPSLSVRNR